MKWLTMCVGPDVVTLLRSPLADALVDSKIVPALHSLLQELKKERNTSSNARLYPRLRHMLQRGCITVPSQKEMTTICARLRWAAKMYKIEQASSEKQMKEAITKARNSRTKLWARSIARTIVPTSEILNLDHPYNKSVDAAKFIKDLGENGWRGMGSGRECGSQWSWGCSIPEKLPSAGLARATQMARGDSGRDEEG
ncbi:unnamed protein product [Zymoseptoria tritici ST99CH_3D7]|uniref:Uncharacterized protein n=1 Tax=Zymoseptoria tritici (strain ST99CH_3D7) TaxID=1276538 RepID=A0A1X7RJ85_ZYMT9|nr:unnamed protein product [Zymoseptoria tritici ST99CH_3D7]